MALITIHTHTHFACRLSRKGGKLLFGVERDQTILFFLSFVLSLREMNPVIISSIMFEEYLNYDGHFYSF